MREHIPKRPTWDCGGCGQEWPCVAAKEALSHEYLGCRPSLLLYLALQRWTAFDDLAAAGSVPPEIDDRFLGWIR